jgi:hypothetical protein
MSEDSPRGRVRLRYSLRALFVVLTLACLWLGWNVNIVRNRNALRAQERVEREQRKSRTFTFIDYLPPAQHYILVKGSRDERMRAIVVQRDFDRLSAIKLHSSEPTTSSSISWLRLQLGDQTAGLILVRSQVDHDLARARFPEAHIFVMP